MERRYPLAAAPILYTLKLYELSFPQCCGANFANRQSIVLPISHFVTSYSKGAFEKPLKFCLKQNEALLDLLPFGNRSLKLFIRAF